MKFIKLISSFLFIFCFFLLGNIRANTPAKEIQRLENLKSSLEKTEKVNVLNELSVLYLQEKNIPVARENAKTALNLAKNINYPKGIAKAHTLLGKAYQADNDDENAMKSYFQSLELYKTLGDELGIAQANNNIGEVFLMKNEPLEAISKFRVAQTTLEKLKNNDGLAIVLNNLGEAYLKKTPPEYGPAKEYFSHSFKQKLKMKDYLGAATTARKIAEYDIQLRDYESAIIQLRAAMETYQNLGDTYNIAEIYHTMGEVYRLQKYPEDAINFYNKAANIRTQIKDSIGLANTYKSIGLNHLALKNRSKSKQFFEQSAALLSQIGLSQNVPIIYKSISRGYESMGDIKASLAYQKKYSDAKEKYQSIEKQKAALDIATMYKSKFETEKYKNEIEKRELQRKKMATTRNFLIATSLLGLLLIGVLYNSFIRKKKANKELLIKNDKIANMNEQIQEKNNSLDTLNSKLVEEMAERESLEQTSFARDRFLATMSNEMRTPLNIIRGLTHLLLTEEPRKDQVENLRTLQFSANNLMVFINDVLDYSNIEAGKISFDNINFKPRDVMNEVKERFSLPAKDKKISLNFSYDHKLPEILNGDSTRLNQIVTNLMSTALKHTHEGAIDVDVSVNELIKNKLTLLIEVRDTGEGISEEKLDIMFRRFSRTAEDMYDGYGTSGLGLAICKRLVDLQNGKVEAKSEIGKGTIFRIYLPYTLAKEENTPKNDTPKTYDHLKGQRVLLVEDNKINQLVVSKVLSKIGIEVTTANNGQEALDRIHESYFDLILMDIQMPIMDGYRTTAEIRKFSDPRVRDVPIIALTASAYLTEKEKAKLFGMDDHVGKPFGSEDLLDKVDFHIQLSKTE